MTPATVQEELLTIQGMRLQVFRAGHGPTLVVLHDCEVLTEWQAYHEVLAQRFSVVAPSHPGFGCSERPEGINCIDDLVYLYLNFLEGFGPEPVNLLGLGMGGWIAAEIAIRCQHRLRRLILSDAVGIKVSDRTEVDILETFIMNDEELLAASWHDPTIGAKRMKLPGTAGLTNDEVVSLLRNRETAILLTWKPFMHNPKLRQWLDRVTVPTLLLWGMSDRIVNPDYGRAFQKAIPGAQFQSIPKAGHYPYLERPDEFAAAVAKFLG